MHKKNLSYLYEVFNLPFSSDFCLNGFKESVLNPEFHISSRKLLPKYQLNTEPSKLNHTLGYIQNKDFIFQIENGAQILYSQRNKCGLGSKIAKIFHQPLAYLLFQKDFFVFHGSSFSFNGNAIVISGLSGSGKSETIRALSDKYKFISDDIVAAKISKNKVVCPSGLPFICSEKSGKHKIGDKRDRKIFFVDRNKIEEKELKLGMVIFLKWSDEYSFHELSDKEIFSEILANSFRPLPSEENNQSQRKYLKDISTIINYTKFYVFNRPKGSIEESLKQLIKFINDRN